MTRPRFLPEFLVFALTFVAVGWFHQGGGWNQNARFALVRALVDGGTVAIDDYLVYRRPPGVSGASPLLTRVPVRNANLDIDGTRYAFAWQAADHSLSAVDPDAAGARRLASVDYFAASGDLAYHDGHFHPNKAPGTSFLAVPGYAVARAVGRVAGADPDAWQVISRNAWMASLLGVGLATAAAAVAVLRLARRFGGEGAARVAAVTFALGTMAWPAGTFLVEHNVVGAGLVLAVAATLASRGSRRPSTWMMAAGVAAGWATISNYAVGALAVLPAMACLAGPRPMRRLAGYAAGAAVPLALLAAYHHACFGTPWTTNYAFENPAFRTEGLWLGVFRVPRADVALALLFSPFRGLFFTSPVLLAAAAGGAVAWRRPAARPIVAAASAVLAFLLVVNASFNGWDGGWTVTPRYLGPAMPLVAPLVAAAWERRRSVTAVLALASVGMQLLLVAVDPQVPIGDAGAAGTPVREVALINPLQRYVLPVFLTGRPWPLLEDGLRNATRSVERTMLARGAEPAEAARMAAEIGLKLRRDLEAGEPSSLMFSDVIGPVSANPVSIVEGFYRQVFPPRGIEARAASFNVGEFLAPGSRWSLAPLVLILSALAAALARAPHPVGPATRPTSGRSVPPAPAAADRSPIDGIEEPSNVDDGETPRRSLPEALQQAPADASPEAPRGGAGDPSHE